MEIKKIRGAYVVTTSVLIVRSNRQIILQEVFGINYKHGGKMIWETLSMGLTAIS